MEGIDTNTIKHTGWECDAISKEQEIPIAANDARSRVD
jgi:hypothetical protein